MQKNAKKKRKPPLLARFSKTKSNPEIWEHDLKFDLWPSFTYFDCFVLKIRPFNCTTIFCQYQYCSLVEDCLSFPIKNKKEIMWSKTAWKSLAININLYTCNSNNFDYLDCKIYPTIGFQWFFTHMNYLPITFRSNTVFPNHRQNGRDIIKPSQN